MQWNIEKVISGLYSSWSGQEPGSITPLPPSGSNRQYFRLKTGGRSVVAAFNPDSRENHAFLTLSRHFRQLGLPVPRVLAEDTDSHCYLLTDLGDTTLFSLLPAVRQGAPFGEEVVERYKKTIAWLPHFQIRGPQNLDFSVCYPRHTFDRHSMMWDLNYFKYYFLKISGIPFDEQLLEDDFERFAARLQKTPGQYFMYRDFQSRNVMFVGDKPWFIDYQGGRKGPLAYDIASLLYDAKANIPPRQREELLDHYLDCLEEQIPVDRRAFRSEFYEFVIMRILQALGTYGFRGGVEKKTLFLQSVPYALKNLAWLDGQGLLPDHIPHLGNIIREIAATRPDDILPPPDQGLTVRISSFSYRKGIPADHSGNGGGYVFDCRPLPNPGRLPEYKDLTGKHAQVAAYLEADPGVGSFLDAVLAILGPAVNNYLKRDFRSLVVNFGCTGGQHRSVYCAEKTTAFLRQNYRANVTLTHFEQDNWPSADSQPEAQRATGFNNQHPKNP